jgi:hypothetical protein
MRSINKIACSALLWLLAIVLAGGCQCWKKSFPTPPLGTHSDPIWRRQEAAGHASDLVIYQHEFDVNGDNLNTGGQDHLRSIAARLHCGVALPVIIERSSTSENPQSEFKYPVNPNSELDLRRRDMIVKSLVNMGIPHADNCVVVAPAMAEGITAVEAIRAYQNGVLENNSQNGNYGGTAGGAFGGGLGTGFF